MQRIDSLEELAARIDPTEKLSARTLRKLENRESEITMRALRPIAAALKVPLGWFLADSIFDRYGDDVSPFQRELERVKSRLDEIEDQLGNGNGPEAPPTTSASSARPPSSKRPSRKASPPRSRP